MVTEYLAEYLQYYDKVLPYRINHGRLSENAQECAVELQEAFSNWSGEPLNS